MGPAGIRLLLADVDGTLVTPDKVLTDRAVAAVHQLGEAGVLFALTSGRPPKGMSMLVEPLRVTTPIAAFNGGLLVDPDMTVLEQRTVPSELATPIVDLLVKSSLSVWVYQGVDWFVPDREGPHVAREAWTVKFEPSVTDDVRSITDGVVKIVGVSDDHDLVKAAATAARDAFGEQVGATQSQPYYLDVTNAAANKGSVVEYLSKRYEVPREQIATIGDMANDVLMFAHSGLSIAMGNADQEVQRAAALRVTSSNEDEGFARAVERFILGVS